MSNFATEDRSSKSARLLLANIRSWHATRKLQFSWNATKNISQINAVKGRAHITNFYGPNRSSAQQCHICEDGRCTCPGNLADWNIGAYPPMAPYVAGPKTPATAAGIDAYFALQAGQHPILAQDFTVTRLESHTQ
jgi:hypothetical protein